MYMIDSAPDAVKDTYLKMKGEQGKKLELKVIGGNYYLYVAKGIWDKKRKKPVNEIIFELSKMERIVEKSGAEYLQQFQKRLKRLSICSVI